MKDKYSYRITWSEEDTSFVGLCAEFPSLSWLADTQEQAFIGIKKLVAEIIVDMEQNQEPLPTPIATNKYSGKLIVRITPALHRSLTLQAKEAQMSLNRLITSKLANH